METEKFPEHLEDEFKKFGVTPIIYRPKGMRYVTVCLLIKGKKAVARGISVCSPSDDYNWQRGHNSAAGRAVKAMYHKLDVNGNFNGDYRNDPRLPISDFGFRDHLNEVPFILKSEYKPGLDSTEKLYIKNFNNLRKE